MDKSIAIDQCPLCQGKSFETLYQWQQTKLWRCQACDMVFANEAPSRRSDFYDETYFHQASSSPPSAATPHIEHIGYQSYEASILSHTSTFSHRLRQAETRLGHAGTLLDYGCAYGHLGQVAQDRGWQVLAADISAAAVHYAHDHFGVEGVVADLSKPPLRQGCFDLVCLYDVIEHVHDPVPVLKQIKPLLNHRGLVHITTPDHNSLSAKLLGKKWYHYKPGEHVVYFSQETLSRALIDAGYRIIKTRASPSWMSLSCICERLSFYHKGFFGFLARLIKLLGLEKLVTPIWIGECEVWAALETGEFATGESATSESATSEPLVSANKALQWLACPSCQGSLKRWQEHWLACEGCDLQYPFDRGVAILLEEKAVRRSRAIS